MTTQGGPSKTGCTHTPLLDDCPKQRRANGELLHRVAVEEVKLLPQRIQHAGCQSSLRLVRRCLQQHTS